MGTTNSKSNEINEILNKIPLCYHDSIKEFISSLDQFDLEKDLFSNFPKEISIALQNVLNTIKDHDNNVSKQFTILKFLEYSFDDSGRLFILLQEQYSNLFEMLHCFLKFYLYKWAPSLEINDSILNNLIENVALGKLIKDEYYDDIEAEGIEEELKNLKKGKLNENKAKELYFESDIISKVIKGVLSWGLFNSDKASNPKLPQLNVNCFDPSLAYFLANNLPPECLVRWIQVFDSSKHGESWHAFQRSITDIGSTLVLIWEKNSNRIFGSFSYREWKPSPKFVEDPSTFLISIEPRLRKFGGTGYNKNFMYFMFGSQTLQNGLGLGGQLDYFGLFIDASFTKGHSKAHPRCSTFNSPQLSEKEEFEIEKIEVWCLREKEVDSDEEGNKASILDNNEAKALLEMTSHKFYSSDLRDPTLDKE